MCHFSVDSDKSSDASCILKLFILTKIWAGIHLLALKAVFSNFIMVTKNDHIQVPVPLKLFDIHHSLLHFHVTHILLIISASFHNLTHLIFMSLENLA